MSQRQSNDLSVGTTALHISSRTRRKARNTSPTAYLLEQPPDASEARPGGSPTTPVQRFVCWNRITGSHTRNTSPAVYRLELSSSVDVAIPVQRFPGWNRPICARCRPIAFAPQCQSSGLPAGTKTSPRPFGGSPFHNTSPAVCLLERVGSHFRVVVLPLVTMPVQRLIGWNRHRARRFRTSRACRNASPAVYRREPAVDRGPLRRNVGTIPVQRFACWNAR